MSGNRPWLKIRRVWFFFFLFLFPTFTCPDVDGSSQEEQQQRCRCFEGSHPAATSSTSVWPVPESLAGVSLRHVYFQCPARLVGQSDKRQTSCPAAALCGSPCVRLACCCGREAGRGTPADQPAGRIFVAPLPAPAVRHPLPPPPPARRWHGITWGWRSQPTACLRACLARPMGASRWVEDWRQEGSRTYLHSARCSSTQAHSVRGVRGDEESHHREEQDGPRGRQRAAGQR